MTESFKVSRRQFCGVVAGGLLAMGFTQQPQQPAQAPLPDAGPNGNLPDPDRAGRPLEPVTARDNDAAIQAIEKRLSCTCGCGLDIYTCRTTDFNCTFSPGYHRQILSLAAAGMTGDEIIAEFVKEHGESVLMAPPKRGFALFGYFGPWVGVTAAAVGLACLIRRWSARAPAQTVAAPTLPSDATPAELERLQRELRQFEA